MASSAQSEDLRILPDALDQVSAVLKRVAAAVETNPGFLNATAAVDAASSELMNASLRVFNVHKSDHVHAGRPSFSRDKIIESTMDCLEARNHASVSVTNLAVAADVSERTLRTAFQDYFGIGPLRYMKLRQLTEVRRALLQAHPAVATVTPVAAHWGVWEMVRFAHEYFAPQIARIEAMLITVS